MNRTFTVLLAFLLWGTQAAILPGFAHARTLLNQAVIRQLRNSVELIPDNRPARPAQVADRLSPGDALATARSSFAELRFNDGSLARLGEQVVFRFVPNTRTFRLSNGTLLLLVPPGQGRTRIQTPNATAGIRGSALFVRYIPGTNTTLVGALTDSGIEVGPEADAESVPLEAGQMALIVDDAILQIYEFDLNTFYETSELVRGLGLEDVENSASVRSEYGNDPAIAQVRAETTDAVANQSPVVGDDTIVNPDFIQISDTSPEQGEDDGQLAAPNESSSYPLSDQIQSILEAGEIQVGPDEPIETPLEPFPEEPVDPIEPTPPEPEPPVDPPEGPGENPNEGPIDVPGEEEPGVDPNEGPIEVPGDDDDGPDVEEPDDVVEEPPIETQP